MHVLVQVHLKMAGLFMNSLLHLKRAGVLMIRSSKVNGIQMSLWGVIAWHVCKMWEHGGCLESFQQVAILKCDHLDHHDVGTFKLRARAQSTGTISTNGTGRCGARLCHFCGGAECMCKCSCTRRWQVCSCADHWKWMGFKSLCGEQPAWHVCKMWEHGGFLESFQQDAISKCGLLECHTWRMCHAWAW